MSQIFIILFVALPLAKARNLVTDTCMKISKADPENIKYGFCVKTFGSDPRSTKASSVDELVDISFNLTSSKSKSITSTINQVLLKDPKFDPFARSALETCSDLYSDGLDDLQTGLEALKGGDFPTAMSRVSAALDNGPDCEDTFKEKEGEVSPLTKENDEYFHLAVISLSLTVLLKK